MLPDWFDKISHQQLPPSAPPPSFTDHVLQLQPQTSLSLESRQSRKVGERHTPLFLSPEDDNKVIASTEPSECGDNKV